MTKYELVAYMTGLLTIIESKEDAGLARAGAVSREYERVYKEFRDIIGKEEEDEARKQQQPRGRSEGRAGSEGDISRSSESNRLSHGDREIDRKPEPRSRVQGPYGLTD